MKTYTCVCGQLIFFENVTCVACGRALGFLPDVLRLSSLEPAGDGLFRSAEAGLENNLYKECQNYSKESVCNWMIPVESSPSRKVDSFCASCDLNETIPDLSLRQNHDLWALMESAKRRLVYSLLNLKLPIANRTEDPNQGLAFAFLSDVVKTDGSVSRVLTGHENGLITLNIVEADDAIREKIRLTMNEPYRTLLGHFRHEIGHYYWDRLVARTKFLGSFRMLFGNEEADYLGALKRHYLAGAPANWQDNYISAYATSHPWEDWAETWAHVMHIQDAVEVANNFGLASKKLRVDSKQSESKSSLPSERKTPEEIIDAWSELSIALNSINRSMGLHDLYPFVLSPPVVKKLRFVFEVISAGPGESTVAS